MFIVTFAFDLIVCYLTYLGFNFHFWGEGLLDLAGIFPPQAVSLSVTCFTPWKGYLPVVVLVLFVDFTSLPFHPKKFCSSKFDLIVGRQENHSVSENFSGQVLHSLLAINLGSVLNGVTNWMMPGQWLSKPFKNSELRSYPPSFKTHLRIEKDKAWAISFLHFFCEKASKKN